MAIGQPAASDCSRAASSRRAGRSQFGAVLCRTTELFLKLFGLGSLDELPGIEAFDPSPAFAAELRERLLQAGEARAGAVTPGGRSPSLPAECGGRFIA